ncbi:MAG: Tetraacyldisaccharide 4'-kinase [Candidatus Gallionella acididurans]|uniref:Tetraacyldisaccharide 4'-kinase n=1 Tax=Candidatus Gallionella acididurans TaxID=1796491 RepID=A0A139BY02_9PROT|nr:MAG: Tetraacyldisaccharide 4'-kinase [Candidatus Gallionella acididurans]
MHWLQNHWHRITPLHLILFPISLVFRLLVAIRRDMYRNGMLSSVQLLLPVIVVGNINVGGTGKTPLTLALARQLAEHGWHPLIVSRGYGGTTRQPQHVNDHSDAHKVGDEPLLMARRNICPVWIGRDRAETARTALQAHPQCDVVLCDDGLQHYRLQRDVEIAVVDGENRFGNGLMLPAGPLREPESRLREVDAVVVNGGAVPAGQYAMRLSGDRFYNLLDPEKQTAADHFQGRNNHAVAGIGNPQRYFQHLETLGISFTPHAFPDHHPFRANDFSFMDCDAILLTEKDAVKCTAFADARYWVLRVDAQIDSDLLERILRKIETHGSETA